MTADYIACLLLNLWENITHVTASGTFAFEGATYIVRLAKASGKPYALRLNDDGTEVYMPGFAQNLRESHRVFLAPVAEREGKAVTEAGVYRLGEKVYRVKIGQTSGRPYAMLSRGEEGGWEYAPGVVQRLRAEDKLSLEEAAAIGMRTGVCVCCGRTLTHEVSVALGIGPICGGHYYGKAAYKAFEKKSLAKAKALIPA